MKSFSALTLFVGLSLLVGCAPSYEDGTTSDENEIRLEQAPIATSLTELRAGEPYLPGVDETPLAIGSNPCVVQPKVTIAGGQVGSSAAVVQSRESLNRELGFGISGTIPVAGGLSGAAGLSVNTTFDSQSAVVLFQSTGTYESVLNGADSMPNFDAAGVNRCGYGFITRANHRVSAALVVTVRATSNGKDVKANASLGKTGVAEAKANIGNLIKKGSVEITVRFATDVIPNLPQAPFADSAIVVGDSDAEKARAIEKLDNSLNWLASAQSAIESYLLKLRQGAAEVPPAPTQSVRFRFYSGTPQSLRTSIERATDGAIAVRANLRETSVITESWERFALAQSQGRGFEWNVPSAPAKNEGELEAKRKTLLDGNGGKLVTHKRSLEDQLDRCLTAIRNDESLDVSALGSALDKGCSASVPALPIDKKQHDVRQIHALIIDETTNGNPKCPAGSRMPKESEAPIFAPWSRARKQSNDQGIWMEDSGCNFSSGWILDGTPTCASSFASKKGLRICVSSDKGPTPEL